MGHSLLIVPIPEWSSVAPTLRLAKTLGHRGIQISYLTAPKFEPDICKVGARLFSVQQSHQEGDSIRRFRSLGESFKYYPNGSQFDILASRLAFLREAIPIDLMLLDRGLASIQNSRLLRIVGLEKSVAFSSSMFNWDDMNREALPIPTLVFCPEVFELPAFRFPVSNVYHVECSFPPIHADIGPTKTTVDVLVSLGPSPVHYPKSKRTLEIISNVVARNSNLHFAVADNLHKQLSALQDMVMAPNVRFCNQLQIADELKHAKVFVTNGGIGDIKESIASAVPMIVLPLISEQAFNAMRIRLHGLGAAIYP